MINGQSGAFEAFKNWWDHEDQEELRRSCAQGWAWKVWQARAALDSEQQPDVTQLVEVLERVMYCNEVGFLPESVQQAVSAALDPYLKGGEA